MVLSNTTSSLFSLLLAVLISISSATASEIDPSVLNQDGLSSQVPCHNTKPLLSCGGQSLTVGSPFLSMAKDGSCNHLINCSEKGYAMLTWLSQYRVSSIDYSRETLVLAIADFFFDPRSYCLPQKYSLRAELDLGPLGYADSSRVVTVLYDCSFPAGQLGISKDLFTEPCFAGAGGPGYNYWVPYYWAAGDPGLAAAGCSAVSHAVVGESAIEGRRPLKEALQAGFEATWLPQPWCERCVNSGGRCRVQPALHNDGICDCEGNLAYLNRCPDRAGQIVVKRRGANMSAKIVIGAVAGGSFLVACLLLFLFCYHRKLRTSVLFRKKKRSSKEKQVEAFLEKFGSLAPTRYSYSDVETMTSSFSDKLGQGGYGCVYKGKLLDGRLVAVKILNHSKGGGKEFFNEVISIGCTYHINVVSLLGFCMEGSKRVLIYEFMPNGSLEKFIHTQTQTLTMTLQWEKLLEIAIGIARGLDYLHHGCNIGILHFDIKPHNILLDHDFYPKISDFGLAKLCRSAESIISLLGARGTVGYIAPEVFSRKFGGVSCKSDVYSYGMVVLEMVGGRKNLEVHVDHTSEIYFPHWIYKHLDVDANLKPFRVMTGDEAEVARRMIIVGLWCIQTKPFDRPSMSRVLDMLEGRITELQMPPLPILSSPSRSLEHSGTQPSPEIVSDVNL